MTKHFAAGIALGIVGTILVAIVIWLGLVYTGAYNVAASDQNADVVRWTFDTTMRRSVASRADRVEQPANPSEAIVAQGAGHSPRTAFIATARRDKSRSIGHGA